MRWSALAAVLAALCGCVGDLDSPNLSSTADMNRPSFDEWVSTLHRDSDGYYVIEGDMLVSSRELLEKYYNRIYPPEGTLLLGKYNGSLDVWPTPTRYNLTYCVSNYFNNQDHPKRKDMLVSALQTATGGWEAAGDVDFVYDPTQDAYCDPSNTNVVFAVVVPNGLDCNGTWTANSTFPHDTTRRIKICENAFNQGLPGITSTMRHELGHMLGFVHEFNAANVAQNGSGSCQPEAGTDFSVITGIGSGGDPNSVMTYDTCKSGKPSPTLTDYDLEGVKKVYGAALLHDIIPADFSGDGIMDMAVRAGRGGNIYIRDRSLTPPWPETLPDDAAWDFVLPGYGFSTGTQIATGPFDPPEVIVGETRNRADISVKYDSSGAWCIDYRSNGFGYYDECFQGYGYSDAKITPADYDGDGINDLSVKGNDGKWYIDYSTVPAKLTPVAAYASSTESSLYVPGKAIDNSTSTRWASSYADANWITVDLGSQKSISRVRLNWETAYGRNYLIQTSNDNSNWTTIATVTNGDGGIDDLSVNGLGRYVRMLGTARGTGWGYSLWEFEVYSRFGQWNAIFSGYGDGTVTPVPADYDGDGRADLAIKTNAGEWMIDFSNDWGAANCVKPNLPCFGGWNDMRIGSNAIYGNASYVPAPADYDGDGRADLAVKYMGALGTWKIDYSGDGYGNWGFIRNNYGDANWKPIPGKYRFGDHKNADIATAKIWSSAVSPDSHWFIDSSNSLPDGVNDITNHSGY